MRRTHAPTFAGLALALLSLLPTSQARESPRVQVDGIARSIEQNYFDEARGRSIAAGLRAAAARGEFDQLRDAHELASALSTRLEPFDRHFRVRWEAPQPARPATAGGPPAPGAAQQGAPRDNHGVQRVEVLSGNLGYLDLRGFAGFEFGATDQPARKTIDAALQLLSGTDALIIDLRDNRGGAPQMVGYLSSAFVKPGADIFNTFHGRDRTMTEAPLDWHPQPRLDAPLFLLTSGRTASAGEAFAYTLQSAGRATVVGDASMGAANPGAEVDAGHGFSVFVSFATPINPITKANWEGRGVTPDVAAAPSAALATARRLALEAVLARGLAADAATDTRWALEALQAETAPVTVRAGDYVGRYGALAVAEAGGRLVVAQGRRPQRALLPLGGDRFAIAENPSQRVVFERDAKGNVVALESRWSDGTIARHGRGE